jgi:drug/metabolite transporter (DMT)-like permease
LLGVKQNLLTRWVAIRPKNQSAILMVTGISILGISDNFVPYVSELIGLGQFHFMRSFIALACILCLARITNFTLLPVNWWAVFLRTAFLAISMGLFFSVLSFLPVAVAGAGLFTSPIFVLLFSLVLFGLRPGWRRILAVLIGSTGVFLILRPDKLDFNLLQFMPVLAGAFYALASITTRRLCANESPLALVMAYFLFLGIGGLIWAVSVSTLFDGPFTPEAKFIFRGLIWTSTEVWLWVALMAIMTVIAAWMLFRAYQIAETSYAVIYEYSYLITGGFVGLILWNAELNLSSVGGMVLIILSGVIITLAKRQHAQN